MIKQFKFEPYLKQVLWGGDKIASFKNITLDKKDIGESWEISGVPGRESIVSSGPDKGLTLPQLIDKYRGALVGDHVYKKFRDTFPLLIKIIDARRDLSVQVHPDDALAALRHNSFGKTEMWYIIDADPGAKIYSGLSKHITPDDYTHLVEEKRIMDVVAVHDSHPGDIFFLPAGRIHAIGAGNIVAEIQQTSDITYRVYDFDRRDDQGHVRELHTELAKDAIDYKVYDDYCGHYDRDRKGIVDLVDCNYFDVRRVVVDGEIDLPRGNDSFVVVMCIDGSLTIDIDGDVVGLHRGETLLIAACACRITVAGSATLLTATVGE